MTMMDLIKDIGVILGVLTALCALLGGLFWSFKYFLELYLKPIEKNQDDIKLSLNNHVTDTNKVIKDLKSDQKEEFNSLKLNQKEEFNNLKSDQKAGFDKFDKRFDDINKRFNDINKQFNDINKRFDNLYEILIKQKKEDQ